MKHLFFVSVAVGIFSGTSLSGKAQTSISSFWKGGTGALKNNSSKFIEGVELKSNAVAVKVDSMELKIDSVTITETVVDNFPVFERTSVTEKCSLLQFKYAQLLHKEVETVKNLDLFNFIDGWWGTRYRYGGTTKAGVDCSAYVGALLNEVYGISPPRTARAQYSVCEKIDKNNLQEGDLVFFNTTGGVSHVGLYLGNSYFTHSGVSSGVTISSLNDKYYSKRFISGGRFITESLGKK